MSKNVFFQWPETSEDHSVVWSEADKLEYVEQIPEWLDKDDYGSIRILGTATWAYVCQKDQPRYFEELENAPDSIIVDQDGGDGCVSILYVRLPEGSSLDVWPFSDQDNIH